MRRATWVGLVLLAAACAAGPEWRDDLTQVLVESRGRGQDLAVWFALPGLDRSDAMRGVLDEPAVLAALGEGDFAAVVCDGRERARLYGEWVGYGEGFGLAVLDANGRCYAARPGPQDAAELAAFLRQCTAARRDLASLRSMVAQPTIAPMDQHMLGCRLLELGCVAAAEPLLLDAALASVTDARHRLARLYATKGNLDAARRWLRDVPWTPPARVSEGYVRFKERRWTDAVAALEAALAEPDERLGTDRQRALLYLGKALHEAGQDERAVPLLEALAREGTGSTFEAAAVHALGHVRGTAAPHGH